MDTTTREALRLGIDIGGTAIKYGVVNTATGNLASPIAQLPTPNPATPDAVAGALQAVWRMLSSWDAAPLPHCSRGCCLPRHHPPRHCLLGGQHQRRLDRPCRSTSCSAKPWAGPSVSSTTPMPPVWPRPPRAPARDSDGTVLVLTLGTGIGSALVVDGTLVPNFELGHLEIGGEKAEARTSAVARERDGLGWLDYSARLQDYLSHVEFLFSPELIILGGGISVRHEEFLPHISLETPVLPALLHNTAGVVGAALTVA